MGFSAAVEWDVRTTGSDSNGGGFRLGATGTDYSVQDAPQVTFTDLVIDATTNTKCTSAAFPFSSVSVGNIINITSGTGFTVQRVEILSVAGAVATCDKSLGTLSSTGGNGKLGGGLLTIAAAVALAISLNSIHIKAGTYTLTAALANAFGGQIWFLGYGVAHNDFGTRPLITTATNSTVLFALTTTGLYTNLTFSNTAATRAIGFYPANSGTNIAFHRCKFTGFTNAVNGDNAGAHWIFTQVSMTDCEATGCTSQVILNNNTVILSGCSMHDNTGGTAAQAAGVFNVVAIRSLFTNNTGGSGSSAVLWSQGGLVSAVSCTFFGNARDCIQGSLASFENNIFYSNSAWAVENYSGGSSRFALTDRANGFGLNASGNLSAGTLDPSDILLTANPFTASGSDDYSLNATAGGGAALKGAGYPGTFPGGASTGVLDIGAVQSAAASAVSSPMIYVL